MYGEGGGDGDSVLNANLEFGNVILTTDIFKRIESIGHSSFNSLRSRVCGTSFHFRAVSSADTQRPIGTNRPTSQKSRISAPGH